MVDDFKEAMPHLKFTPCKLKLGPQEVPADYPNWAVWLADDASSFARVEAHIMPAQVVKKHGVIPNNDNSKCFNCVVGDYEQSECTVYLKVGAHDEFTFLKDPCAWLPDGYIKTSCVENEVDKLLHDKHGSYGFFHKQEDAIKACQECIDAKIAVLNDKMNNAEFTMQCLRARL